MKMKKNMLPVVLFLMIISFAIGIEVTNAAKCEDSFITGPPCESVDSVGSSCSMQTLTGCWVSQAFCPGELSVCVVTPTTYFDNEHTTGSDQNCDSYRECQEGFCPSDNASLSNGDVCVVSRKACSWDPTWNVLNGWDDIVKLSGIWDKSSASCIICSGVKEGKLLGNSAGTYVESDGTCTKAGNGFFEAACGADAQCDEKVQGNACNPPAGGSCDASGKCVVAVVPPACTCAEDTPACCKASCAATDNGDPDCDCENDYGSFICDETAGETCPGNIIAFHDSGKICCDVPCTATGEGWVVYMNSTFTRSYAAGDCLAGPAQIWCGLLDDTDDNDSCPTGKWACEDDKMGPCAAGFDTCGAATCFNLPVLACTDSDRCVDKYRACDCTCAAPAPPTCAAPACNGNQKCVGGAWVDCVAPTPICQGGICVAGTPNCALGSCQAIIGNMDVDCMCGTHTVTIADINNGDDWCCATANNVFDNKVACDAACGAGPGPGVEICVGGVDEDGDGLIDCADPDCAADPACAGPSTAACDPNDWYYCNPLRGSVETLVQGGEQIIGYILGLIGSIALLLIIISGAMYMTSAGNEERIATSKRILTGAVIGLGIALLAYSLLAVIMGVLGV